MRQIPEIIEELGGFAVTAVLVGTTDWAVKKWPQNGIPPKHWSTIVRATKARIGYGDLARANERLQRDLERERREA